MIGSSMLLKTMTTELAIHTSIGDPQTSAAVCAAAHPLRCFPFRKEKLHLANYYLNNKGQVEEYSICFLPFVFIYELLGSRID